jgi:hypothetical protein
MKKQQSGGVNITGQGTTNVARDLVGRDKYEQHYVAFKEQQVGWVARVFFTIIGFIFPGIVGAVFGVVIGAAIDAGVRSGGAVIAAGGIIGGLFFGIGFSSYVISATKRDK